jgi:FAD:protein FMN transferase
MRRASPTVRRARALLGTLVEVRVAPSPRAEAALERAFGAIERVHRAMSAQESTSDIGRLRARRRSSLDPWTRRVLERAEEIRLASGGLFDAQACGYTLDGIAKGFAVDRAVEALQAEGIASGVVNAGGDLRVFGEGYEDIYVRPSHHANTLVHIGRLKDAAVATSGAALLIDPRSSRRRARAAGASVLAADCATADALTKPCLLEPDQARDIAARLCAHVLRLEIDGRA